MSDNKFVLFLYHCVTTVPYRTGIVPIVLVPVLSYRTGNDFFIFLTSLTYEYVIIVPSHKNVKFVENLYNIYIQTYSRT